VSSSSGEHGRLGSLKAVIELCIFGPSLFGYINQNFNLRFHQIDFWFEFFDIHMNEKSTTCHGCHVLNDKTYIFI
jgi:hypothetical protein